MHIRGMMKTFNAYLLTAALLVVACTLSCAAHDKAGAIGSFSGSWSGSITEEKTGVPGKAFGPISITVYPDGGYFTCKLGGTTKGNLEKDNVKASFVSKVKSSECKGTYVPETGAIDGSMTMYEKGHATVLMPGMRPERETCNESWPATIFGKVGPTTASGTWIDDEGTHLSWNATGGFSVIRDR
jgi:hypothetical protein